MCKDDDFLRLTPGKCIRPVGSIRRLTLWGALSRIVENHGYDHGIKSPLVALRAFACCGMRLLPSPGGYTYN